MRWWTITLLGFFGYLLFMLASIPAQHALGWLEAANLPLVMQNATGTIWSGQATQTAYKNVRLGAADWRFAPLGLLRGRLEYHFALRDQGQEIKGRISSNPLGDQFQLRDVVGLVNLNTLLSLLEQNHFTGRGRLDLDLREVEFSPKRLSSAEGRIRWLEAGITNPVPLELGGLQFDLVNQEEKVLTRISDLQGPIKVDTEVSLTPDGKYLVQGRIKPQGADTQGLAALLRSIGKPLPDGSIQINHKGQL